MDIRWTSHFSPSVAYALAARAERQAGRPAMIDASLRQSLDELRHASGALRELSPDVECSFWRRLAVAQVRHEHEAAAALALESDLQSELEASWRRTPGMAETPASPSSQGARLSPLGWPPEPSARRLEELADVLRQAVERIGRANPGAADQLPFRSRPFIEQWEARGPGLVRRIARGLDVDLAGFSVKVAWVHPFHGGGGWVDEDEQTVLLEAVLVNPFAPVPEPLRLGWFLSHLLARKRGSDRSPRLDALERRIARVDPRLATFSGSLALVPLVLAAGEYVEWTMCDAPRMALALEAWMFLEGEPSRVVADLLDEWWNEEA